MKNGFQIIWNFFATNHGKRRVDNAKANFKQEVKKEQIMLSS